jgi:hypothetical protein
MQKMGELWKNMSDEKRKKYVEMEQKEKEKYDIAMKDYNDNNEKNKN